MSCLTKRAGEVLLNEALKMITETGASGTLKADFLSVAECCAPDGSPKYAKRPVMEWLAKVIVGSGGGANKDTPLFELCHLIHTVNCFLGKTDIAKERLTFFIGVEKASPSVYRDWFLSKNALSGKVEEHITVDEKGLNLEYPDGTFSIRYGRIPFLAALHEFLCIMDQCSFYEQFNELFDTLSLADNQNCDITFRKIQDASNSLSSSLRSYRRSNMPQAQHDEKFDKLFNFLKEHNIKAATAVAAKHGKKENNMEAERQSPQRLDVDDKAILDFWLTHSYLEEFRVYRAVFDNFVKLIKSLETAEVGRNIDHASVIGTDREKHEVEPDDEAASFADYGDWQSPLAVFDEEPAVHVKFFKQKSERQPIELLMKYGPYAKRLPLAFLRLETFGQIQAGISNDLRVKRSQGDLRDRMTCRDAATYLEIQAQLKKIKEHVKQLQLAALYALRKNKHQRIQQEGNVVSLFDDPLQSEFDAARGRNFSNEIDEEDLEETFGDAKRAFQSFTRAGFTEEELEDEGHLEAFRIGAGALIEVGAQLQNFLSSISRVVRHDSLLEEKFKKDQEIFSNQFHTIYGVLQ